MKLEERDIAVLMGCLNDALGYPYKVYDNDIREKSTDFQILFDKIRTIKKMEKEDIPIALLALTQSLLHMDSQTLIALHDDVTLQEIESLISKIKSDNVYEE